MSTEMGQWFPLEMWILMYVNINLKGLAEIELLMQQNLNIFQVRIWGILEMCYSWRNIYDYTVGKNDFSGDCISGSFRWGRRWSQCRNTIWFSHGKDKVLINNSHCELPLWLLKFGFPEKATKFEKKSLTYFCQERHVLCAQQRTCQKVDEDF